MKPSNVSRWRFVVKLSTFPACGVQFASKTSEISADTPVSSTISTLPRPPENQSIGYSSKWLNIFCFTSFNIVFFCYEVKGQQVNLAKRLFFILSTFFVSLSFFPPTWRPIKRQPMTHAGTAILELKESLLFEERKVGSPKVALSFYGTLFFDEQKIRTKYCFTYWDPWKRTCWEASCAEVDAQKAYPCAHPLLHKEEKTSNIVQNVHTGYQSCWVER